MSQVSQLSQVSQASQGESAESHEILSPENACIFILSHLSQKLHTSTKSPASQRSPASHRSMATLLFNCYCQPSPVSQVSHVSQRSPTGFSPLSPFPSPLSPCVSASAAVFRPSSVSRFPPELSHMSQSAFFSEKSRLKSCVLWKVCVPLQRFSAHEDQFRVERFF